MRKFLIPLLLASALTPAAAYAKDGDFVRGMRTQAERGERAKSSDDSSSADRRPQRAEQSNRDERPAQVERQDRPAAVERSERPVRFERAERQPGGERDAPPVQEVQQVQVEQPVQVEQVRRTERRREGFVDGIREVGREASTQPTAERRRDRDGDHNWSGNRDGDRRWSGDRDGNHRWSRDWRHDGRYDWRHHRSRHHSLFRLGHYYDPYGWGYRRWSIGFNLWPSYFGSSFWLNDPWMYRLPQTYGPYRWVRYYDDAVLVNIYTGQVVDVIYNFFW